MPQALNRTILPDLADNTALGQVVPSWFHQAGGTGGGASGHPVQITDAMQVRPNLSETQKALAVATRCRVSANCRLQASRPKGMESCKREWQSEVIVVLNVYKRLHNVGRVIE